MKTGVIIAIVAVVVIVLIAAFLFSRARRRVRVMQRERELGRRRDTAVGEHREAADAAEQRARRAELEAQRDRAEAEAHSRRAQVHEDGLADDELIREDERDEFAGTSATANGGGAEGADRATRSGRD